MPASSLFGFSRLHFSHRHPDKRRTRYDEDKALQHGLKSVYRFTARHFAPKYGK